jgi:MFS family permease
MKRGRMDALFRVAISSMLVLAPVAVLAPLAPNSAWALVGFGLAVLLFSMAASVAPTALQIVAPNELRGQTSSVFSFMSIVVGLGAGPTLVALFTDQVFGSHGSLRYSLAIIGGAAALGCAWVLSIGRLAFGDAVLAARDRWSSPS